MCPVEGGGIVLDERQTVVCELIASGIPITEVSEKSGVARSTIYEWKKLDEVKARVEVLGQEYLSQTLANIKAEGPKSLKALIKLRDHASSEKVRLDACAKILDKLVSNATKIEIADGRDDKDDVSVDVLDQEIKDFDEE